MPLVRLTMGRSLAPRERYWRDRSGLERLLDIRHR